MPRLINQLSPNPRLQRTRSAPLRSPLSRKSFGVMKQNIGARRLLTGAVLFLVTSLTISVPPKPQTRYRIFFPELILNSAEGERIDRLEISMTCGSFRAISVIPEDWSVQVVSPSSARTRLSADAGHGSTALWNLDQLQGAVTISVDDAACFDLSAKITAAVQGSNRVMDFPRSKLVLQP